MKQIESHIYPGEYVPNEIYNEVPIDSKSKSGLSNYMINITEDKFHLEVDVFLPGLNKHDIKLEAKNNCVIVIVNQSKNESRNLRYLMHEFENTPLQRKIKLPQHSDIAFITAVFEHGVLKIHVPKNNYPTYSKPQLIAIY